MKKVIVATMLFSVVGLMHASHFDTEPVVLSASQPEKISALKKLSKEVCSLAKTVQDARVLAAATAVTLHTAKNGVVCPLVKDARNPIAAAAGTYAAVKMLQSEKKSVRYMAVVPASAAAVAAVLTFKK